MPLVSLYGWNAPPMPYSAGRLLKFHLLNRAVTSTVRNRRHIRKQQKITGRFNKGVSFEIPIVKSYGNFNCAKSAQYQGTVKIY